MASHFDVCKEMAKRNLDIRLSTLDNVTNLRYSSKTKGTTVSIEVDGNIVAAIGLDNKFVGGLLLCDRTQYFAVAHELDEAEPPSSGGAAPQEPNRTQGEQSVERGSKQ
jgi:hypothetical protein